MKRPGGRWTMTGGMPVAVEHWDIGPAIVLVPSEDVLLLTVDLPVARAKRLAALPFAIEERIAAPLEGVHIALGAEVAPRCFLAGVVAAPLMRDWVAALDAADLGHAALVPDAAMLPVPPTGAWSVAVADGRVRVRTDTGGGFAVPHARFVAAWRAGGSLACRVHGVPLAFDFPGETIAAGDMPTLPPPLDLRQGDFAVPRQRASAWRRLGTIAAAGIAAHAAIAAAGTLALRVAG